MRIIILVAWAIVMVSIAGCAGNRETVLKATAQTRHDIFQVVPSSQIVPGKALLKIEFPIKTYKARLGGKYFKHNDPPYTAIVNIDGQTVELTDEPVLEDLSGDFMKNPEVGTGWKYVFKKILQLKPGSHRITIAIPLSNIVTEKSINLKDGENILKIGPKYITPVSRYSRYPRFSHGLSGITVQLNSQVL
ncbi:hypothetical protein [Pelobacter propionicus]|uniref:Lipoprotein, putative n=1 Tax=Pelobacter propionicus (strain DSM 2379 / NBRC 103807 / OttBd1) TaxID=338966 RepID=A0R7N3_PELPD|nr:hypothetical protein [Pelobacter propionicus]ABL01243.1 lipoprotein, putative [Pelobacter propionicus DSM 2379]